ncbi:MAG: hypothetical protein Q7U40_09005 [Desulfatirhabdiaceae bacterium]|nr:hypothetical protein [Desulfatirhabdiaceae bacterium]
MHEHYSMRCAEALGLNDSVGPNGSDTFPSTAIETNPVLARANAHISFWDGLEPPTKGTWCSGIASSN